MIILDPKFFEHLIKCLEIQKTLSLQPLKYRSEWRDKIDKCILQCKGILEEERIEYKKRIAKHAMDIIPDTMLLNSDEAGELDNTESFTPML